MSFRRQSQLAQSSIEFMAMTVFVIVGILIGGPYVVRGINSNFKALEEGAITSHREKLDQASQQQNLGNLPSCDCPDMLRQGCGDNSNSCPPTQAYYSRVCTPLGCEADLARMGVPVTMSECRNEAYPPTNCCEPMTTTGRCGVNAVSAPGGRCPDGQMETVKMCGSPTKVAVFGCQLDPACNFVCGTPPNGSPPDANSTPCPDTTVNLFSTSNWNYVGTCGPGNKCEATCNPGFVPVNGACNATCGNGVCEDGRPGRPDYGERVGGPCIQDCPLPPAVIMGNGCGSCPFGSAYYVGNWWNNGGNAILACPLYDNTNKVQYYGSTDWNYPYHFFAQYSTDNFAQVAALDFGPFGYVPYAYIRGAICSSVGNPVSWKMMITPVGQGCSPMIQSWTGFYACNNW